MPQTEAPFIIGVIREREKNLLDSEHFIRFIEATSLSDALRVLNDTVYAAWLNPTAGLEAGLNALASHLISTQRWLDELLDQARVSQFIAARYDGLNVAEALIAYGERHDKPSTLSPLGWLDHELLYSAIWHQHDLTSLPDLWRRLIISHLTLLPSDKPDWKKRLIEQVAEATMGWYEQCAVTPLMTKISQLYRDRYATDRLLRTTDQRLPDIMGRLQVDGYTHLTLPNLTTVRELQDSLAYELSWDKELMTAIAGARFEPIGYDPILSFWYRQELEIKTLHLLLTAKANHLPKETLLKMISPLAPINV